VSTWLHSIVIYDGCAKLADGSEEALDLDNATGCVFLRGGELTLKRTGYMIRTGRSGLDFHFVDRAVEDSERDDRSSGSGSFSVMPGALSEFARNLF